MKKIQKFFFTAGLIFAAACLILASCTKEGPQGLQGAQGPTGKDGTDGKDAAETCKLCHAKEVVDRIATEFQLSKHFWGAAAFEEAGNTTCGPCHVQKAYVYVCANNTSTAFTFNATTNKWINGYTVPASETIGALGCFTCHTSLHTTYAMSDLTLTNTAAVPLTMWGGAKTVNLTQGGGSSNLCVKCHQPRPMTCAYDPAGRLLNYDSVKNFPSVIMYDSTAGAKNTMVRPTYRMHIHYGAVGAVYAGTGGIEYPGSVSYTSSPHTTLATCGDCHMASPMTGVAGGHAFNMRNGIETVLGSSTSWNFNGCNVEGCHKSSPIDANSAKFKATRTEIKGLLDALATKINAAGGGTDILHVDATTSNLWAGISTKNYDGYMDIYSSSTNPSGYWRDPANTSAINMAKPKFPKLLMVQLGAIINFQFCLREYSLGIHNTQYVRALLTNSVEAMNAAGL
ncbi:MAG: hypothetical protein Q8M08_05760 [Bacteroidales bacterium]|nr:hypothetical protein [Bacteroidales bacterium]